jgi:HD-like signal output (HDOD) protein
MSEQSSAWPLPETLDLSLIHRLLQICAFTDGQLALNQALQNPTIPSSKIARLIHLEPCAALHILQLANNPLYRRARAPRSVAESVHHLGPNIIGNFIATLSDRSVYRCQQPDILKRIGEWRQHSIQVALISGILAQKTPGFDPDQAVFAGLMHDIGTLALLIAVDQQKIPLPPEAAEAALKSALELQILDYWQIPEQLKQAIRQAEHWYRDDDPEPCYSDLTMIAKLHCLIGKPGVKQLPQMDLLPAYRKIARGKLDIELSIKMLDQARDELQHLTRVSEQYLPHP